MIYEITEWNKYQHYKERNPPWIKLHYELLTSKTWVMLDDASRVLAIAIMLLASRSNGEIDASPTGLDYLQRVAYLSTKPDLEPLINAGFIHEKDLLQADASILLADASELHTNARPETEKETEKEGEGENINVSKQANSYKQWDEDEFFAECKRVHETKHILSTDEEGTRFFLYWTEPDAKGRMKFAKQSTWDTARRMITWRDNSERYQRRTA